MKKYLLFISLIALSMLFISCLTSGTLAQEEDLSMQVVVDVEGLSTDEIYIQANEWFVENFNNAESVIQFSDKEAGIIKGKYSQSDVSDGAYTYRITSIITFEVKQNRYRATINNPYYKVVNSIFGNPGNSGVEGPVKKQSMLDKIRPQWARLLVSLEERIITNA